MMGNRVEIRRNLGRWVGAWLGLVLLSSTASGFQLEPPEPPPIDLKDPATADVIAGRVVDGEGKPFVGAKIYYAPTDAVSSDGLSVRAVSGDDGRFRFLAKDMTYLALDGLPARRSGQLIATAEGCGPDILMTPGFALNNVNRFNGQFAQGKEWTLTLIRGDVPIRGRLLDSQGRPVVGATITLQGLSVPAKGDLDAYLGAINVPNQGAGFERSFNNPAVAPGVQSRAVSDRDGRFRLEGLGRDRICPLWVRGPGIVDTMIQVMTRDDLDFRVGTPGPSGYSYTIFGASFTHQFQQGKAIRGVVLDKETGAPLAGIDVCSNTNYYGISTTDERGRFVLEGIMPGQKDVAVTTRPRPGQPHLAAGTLANLAGETFLECPRGLPFRLKVLDEAGQPVEAEVSYSVLMPNDFYVKMGGGGWTQPGINQMAARQPDGSYLGVALPGPGAVKVKVKGPVAYREAYVDPKAFFEPGRTDWTPQEMYSAYGTQDQLAIANGIWESQHDYAAIVLVNPPEDSKPLELEATVVRDRPRQITILDPEGRPLVGVRATGLKYNSRAGNVILRASTIPLSGLHPARSQRITFIEENRKLIGFLMARGDGDSPYTVRMQPWAVAVGRVVDAEGKPLGNGQAMGQVGLTTDNARDLAARDDATIGIFQYVQADPQGKFRIERLVPGQKYTGIFYVGNQIAAKAFEDLTFAPGEVKELGDRPGMKPAEPGP